MKMISITSSNLMIEISVSLLQNILPYYTMFLYCHYHSTVEPPNKGHFGTNINSSGLSTI